MLEWLIYWGIFVGLYSWGGGEAYIWNEASVSICGGGAYIRGGGLYSGGDL